MKPLLEGQLHPLYAHHGVHGVAQLLVFGPLVLIYLAGVPQHVGGHPGAVFSGGGGDDPHPGEALLLHLGDEGDVHVLGEHVGVVGHLVPPQVDLVQHPGQLPHFPGDAAAVLGEPEGLPRRAKHPRQAPVLLGQGGLFLLQQAEGDAHFRQQLPRLGPGQGRVLHPADGPLLRQRAQGGAHVRHLALLVRHLVGQGVGGGVPPGGGFGDGQGVRPLHPLLPADLQQAGEDIQPVRAHGVPVQGDVIAHLVGDQHPAIAV